MLRYLLLSITAVICCNITVSANDYEDAWKALHKNDRKTARVLLQKAMADASTSVDAYLTYIYLQTFEGKEADVNNFLSTVYKKVTDANPYLYSLWFNDAVLGDYGKKSKAHQLELLRKLVTDPGINGSIKSAARYVFATHYQYSNDFNNAHKEWSQMESVGPEWQYVGPFDNLSGSGFNKNYGPLEHPEAAAKFTSVNNAIISWFTPNSFNKEGWTLPYAHFRYNTAVVYAQAFINAPSDMKVLLNAGASGSLKVWINDQPVLSESKELVTELDYYSNYIQLKKGYNRILVQLGYTDNSFPNFIIRLTDDNHNAIKGLSYNSALQPYVKATPANSPLKSLKHFAEAFFEKKIQDSPENFLNYILLSQAYLRNKKTAEGRKVVTDALEKFPNNSLLRFQLMQCLLKDGNNTLLSQEVERIKETDPECLLTYKVNIARLQEEKKYEEAFEELEKFVAMFGEDESTMTTRIQLLGAQNKMDELVTTIEKGYRLYPQHKDMVRMMFSLTKNLNKNAKGAIKIYESFLKNNFDYQLTSSLAAEYNELGLPDKALDQYQRLRDQFPYDPEQHMNIAKHYYDKQQFSKALEYTKNALAQAPYVAAYWESLGLEQQQLRQNNEAIESFRKALYYDANNYGARERLRELQKKPAVWKAFPETDVYALIRNAPTKAYDYNFYYLLDEKSTVVYPEGATELYVTMAVRILNEKGIDDWKHTSLPYNPNQQSLLVEKAEVVKKNGSKMKAEQDGGDLVFTGLEAGDALVIRYKIQYYSHGRLAKEFWDKYSFNAFVPVELTRYSLLIAKNIPIQHKLLNGSLSPAVSTYDDFNLYIWEVKDAPIIKDETLMPPSGDVALSLHLSTMPAWSAVVAWYRDLSSSKIEEDFEVKQVFHELFPSGTAKLTELQKARIIYKYITGNIRYSSISFRQSAYTPQKPAVTINTRLGDCKDLATLFVVLGNLANINANLVLVDTRDNGLHEMLLPSVEFNHCIVKTQLDGKEYFLELTDNDLPFASLPYNLHNAAYLVISSDTLGAKLQYLHAINRTKDKLRRDITISIKDTDISLSVKAFKTGSLTSSMRADYAKLSNEKQKEMLEKSLSSNFKNPVKLSSLHFQGLEPVGDSVLYDYTYKVSNEVAEVGEMGMIKIPFGDVVASMDNFSVEERQYPVEYWKYENTDEYETIITIHAPDGKQFIEVPKNEECSFRGSRYSLQFVKKANNQLQIIRKASLVRDNIEANEYAAMKAFFNKIVKAESRYIVFK
jgi:predicted Zn-dependent protease